MQRHSVVAEIFGYLVCLLAVAVFFVSVKGIVNGVFSAVHPTPQTRVMMRAGGGRFGPGPIAMRPPPGMDITAMRVRAQGDARYNAVRRLVLAIVMLVVSVMVFRRSFDWLNPSSGGVPNP